ncbi:MAG: metallophosphoesterase [Anaeroplasmataceae bacterium]
MSVQSTAVSSTSITNVYLIVSDLHKSYKNKANRISYKTETDMVEDEMINLSLKYRKLGYRVHLVFLGDVFDTSYRDLEAALEAYSSIHRLERFFHSISSVVGNHEFTYYTNNPFWFLTDEIQSDRVKNFRGGNWVAKGRTRCINVVDRIDDGDVEILFNHYGCKILEPSLDKTTFGLFHQDVVFKGILDEARRSKSYLSHFSDEELKGKFRFVYLDDSTVLDNYRYCFFGHNHLMYGKWEDTDKNLTLEYLASSGRTNCREVSNDFIERNIPAIIVTDGTLINIEDNKYNLMTREQCVNEKSVLTQQEKYKNTKDRKEVRSHESLDDNPLTSLKTFFGNEFVDIVVDEVLVDSTDSIYADCAKKLREI